MNPAIYSASNHENGLTAVVRAHRHGFAVELHDDDSGNCLEWRNVFVDQTRADEYARYLTRKITNPFTGANAP